MIKTIEVQPYNLKWHYENNKLHNSITCCMVQFGLLNCTTDPIDQKKYGTDPLVMKVIASSLKIWKALPAFCLV